jgi:sugar lactone lactonase YvrE
MLGGDDGRTLYITANTWNGTHAGDGLVLTERVDVPHAGHP